MISNPRFQEKFPVTQANGQMSAEFTIGWKKWCQEVTDGLNSLTTGLSSTASGSFTLTFPEVALGANLAISAPLAGASVGDIVVLHPSSSMTGVIFTGIVTLADTVSIVANNYTTDAVTPGTVSFTVILLRK